MTDRKDRQINRIVFILFIEEEKTELRENRSWKQRRSHLLHIFFKIQRDRLGTKVKKYKRVHTALYSVYVKVDQYHD